MEENTGGKRKTVPSIPANYISILHLKERWINEKERKRKEQEEEEIRRKQQAEEQQRIEEDLKKAEARRKREDLDQRRLHRNDRSHCGGKSRKNESIDGGGARCAQKDELEVTAAIGCERGEDAGLPERNRGFRRKRYDSKKTKKPDAAVKEDVVDESGSVAPPEYVVTENNTPVKDAIQVHRKKGEKEATGKKSLGSRGKTVTDNATDIETQFEDLSIKRGETKNLKAKTRSFNRNRPNQRRDLHPQRVAVEEDVLECGSIAPPESIGTENHTPVKDGMRVYRKKEEKETGKKSVGTREKTVTDSTAIETQCENHSIKGGEERSETKNLKAQTTSKNRNQRNQRQDLHPQRRRMPIGTATMVWVKKGQNE